MKINVRAIKALIFFLIFQFLIIFFVLVLTGTFSTDGEPLEIVKDIARSIDTTVWAIGIGFFILGTFVNFALMFVNIARGGGQI